MPKIEATPLHNEVKDAIMQALMPFKDKLSSLEILAVLSNTVGQCIALQDQSKYTKDQIMILVGNNIEVGNQYMIEQLFSNHRGEG